MKRRKKRQCAVVATLPVLSGNIATTAQRNAAHAPHIGCCSVVQPVAVCCSVLQCVAVCCSELRAVERKRQIQRGEPFEEEEEGRGKGKHDSQMRAKFLSVASWSEKEQTQKYLQNMGQLKEENTAACPLQQYI